MSIDDLKRAAAALGGIGEARALAYPVTPRVTSLFENDHSLNPSKWMYERLQSQIKDFEQELDEEHEIGMRLVSFGPSLLFHIEHLGYHGPDMIIFYGKNEHGENVQLLQHTSQLNVLLVAAKKLGKEPRRIGFLSDSEEKVDNASVG
jgi:hypothetical protein